jgi:GNAT superfamily N-acetyltransferase
MRLVEITDEGGGIVEPLWLARAEPVHRQLRPQLPFDYLGRMRQVFANGARLMVAADDERVLGLGLWRLIENTYEGRRLYVDDLVTDESERSKGVGKFLLEHLQQQARALDCEVLALDSGMQRAEAHKFYFREGMHIRSFCFRKTL